MKLKPTSVAAEMIQRLGKVYTEYLATVVETAERAAREEMCTYVFSFHIREAMEKVGDPMAPDYPALAAEELTSQVEDCRDLAEVPGAQ